MQLQIRDVSKSFRRNGEVVNALQGVSIDIARGALIGIQGPSGAGKSTFLNIVGGLERPSSGTVTADEVTLNDLNDDQLAQYRRDTVGFVFQSAHLLPSLTVFENVMLPLVPIADTLESKNRRVAEVLEIANIAHRAHHLPGEISGGEQQRAAIARAIVNQPRIILADEPTGELDPDNAARIVELLLNLHTQGTTVIMASHAAETLGAAKSLINFIDGRICTTA